MVYATVGLGRISELMTHYPNFTTTVFAWIILSQTLEDQARSSRPERKWFYRIFLIRHRTTIMIIIIHSLH